MEKVWWLSINNIKTKEINMKRALSLAIFFILFFCLPRLASASKNFQGWIVSVGYMKPVIINRTYEWTMLIKNKDNVTRTFVVGLTVGENWTGWEMDGGWFEGVSCNEPCYVGDYDVDSYGRKWVEFLINVLPNEVVDAKVYFQYRRPYFQVGKCYDWVVRLWDDIRNVETPSFDVHGIDQFFSDPFTQICVEEAPPVYASIISYNFPSQAYQEQIITVRSVIKNTGNETIKLYYGLSIGDKDTGVWCNRDCYADGLGDYLEIPNIEPGGVRTVERKFRIRSDYFSPYRYYDVRIAIYDQPYLPFESAIDRVEINNGIFVKELVLDAYAIRAFADKTTVGRKSLLRVTAWIYNNGVIPYNFTIGMSIGMWDAVSGLKYTSAQPALLPACNVECYRDGLGDWVFLYIPPNYTAPVTRIFEVPEYFPINSSIDVAIGVWREPGTGIVSYVYFKNISYVLDIVPPEVMIKEYTRRGIDEIIDTLQFSLRVGREDAKMIFWLLIASVFSIGMMVIPAFVSKSFPPWQIGISIFIIMIILGAIVRDATGPFMPYWIVILFIILVGFIAAKTFHEIIVGGK